MKNPRHVNPMFFGPWPGSKIRSSPNAIVTVNRSRFEVGFNSLGFPAGRQAGHPCGRQVVLLDHAKSKEGLIMEHTFNQRGKFPCFGSNGDLVQPLFLAKAKFVSAFLPRVFTRGHSDWTHSRVHTGGAVMGKVHKPESSHPP